MIRNIMPARTHRPKDKSRAEVTVCWCAGGSRVRLRFSVALALSTWGRMARQLRRTDYYGCRRARVGRSISNDRA